jgi:hypothetical protein
VSRYEVTEIAVYSTGGVGARAGLSVHVIDRLHNHRLMATWRSEDYGSTSFYSREAKLRWMRGAAAEHAAKLNAQHEAIL